MLLNMDTELQHLISISMDKMTSGAGASSTGHGSRKSRGIDLRKALLVAHFLQDVRCAYFNEDYQVVENTIKDLKTPLLEDNMEVKNSHKETILPLKDVDERCKEESKTYLMETDLTSPASSTSSFQSCVTNSDVTVSRIAQVTRPLSVSINTNHIMSCPSSLDLCANKDESTYEEEVPSVCEELEVSSCCEVDSCNTEEEVAESAGELSRDDQASKRMDFISGNKSVAETNVIRPHDIPCLSSTPQCATPNNNETTSVSKAIVSSTTCPLPKKKRPLPKEFLIDDEQVFSCPVSKTSRSKITTPVETSISQFASTTFATSIAHAVTLESRTSTSLSTVCSVMGTIPSYSVQKSGKFKPNPKVVVQLTHTLDPYLPISCSQKLGQRLSALAARAY